MPKVNASLADISTDYQYIEPGTYELEVKEATMEKSTTPHPDSGEPVDRYAHTIKSVVAEPGEHFGKPVYQTMHVTTKKGEPNEIALAELKRYFLAMAPEEAEADEPDTDVLVGRRFIAEVTIEGYKDRSGNDKQRQSLNNRSITAA